MYLWKMYDIQGGIEGSFKLDSMRLRQGVKHCCHGRQESKCLSLVLPAHNWPTNIRDTFG